MCPSQAALRGLVQAAVLPMMMMMLLLLCLDYQYWLQPQWDSTVLSMPLQRLRRGWQPCAAASHCCLELCGELLWPIDECASPRPQQLAAWRGGGLQAGMAATLQLQHLCGAACAFGEGRG